MGKRKKPIDFNSKRLFYSIQDVADHFAVNVSLIRFWEKKFDALTPKKTSGGTRQYTKGDIRQLEVIYTLVKEKGYTLDGAQQALKSHNDFLLRRVEAIEKLKYIKSELLSLEEEFDKLHNIQKYSNTETET